MDIFWNPLIGQVIRANVFLAVFDEVVVLFLVKIDWLENKAHFILKSLFHFGLELCCQAVLVLYYFTHIKSDKLVIKCSGGIYYVKVKMNGWLDAMFF
ncbi:hypothetical protein A8E81_10825 [Burkholderia cenocepacia]|nr:hypothetical protein A8E75_30730 [Burkholderia cenocepacia]ONV25309.1 hypothetical protein A8E74_09810 [Burkholderia cenocepacia]ONV30567.1 hypothetical protein A8E78_17315 [Burkholderia cenocepacia]ONV33472.1 hypothetical protein A8E77_15975 [Burkholderia cenocepacia]ONV40579.1 hypothetical protein A8E82_19680 [Burkholderia cenocepacia]